MFCKQRGQKRWALQQFSAATLQWNERLLKTLPPTIKLGKSLEYNNTEVTRLLARWRR